MLTGILDHLGGMGTVGLCLALAFLAFGETAIFMDLVVPGEVGLVVAGAAATSGHHPIALVIAAAALGALAGDTTSEAVGRRWGRTLIDRFEFTRRRLHALVDRSERYFDQHGGRAVFIGRRIGALRAVVPSSPGWVACGSRPSLPGTPLPRRCGPRPPSVPAARSAGPWLAWWTGWARHCRLRR